MAVALGPELSGDGEAAPAPGLWITDAGSLAPNEFQRDPTQPFDCKGAQSWAEAGEAEGQINEEAFGSGWTEAAVAAGWYWSDEWAGEWCEVWPCDAGEWMIGADQLYDVGEGDQGASQDEANEWQKGGSKGSWEAGGEPPQRWQDRRPDPTRPFRTSLTLRPGGSSKWGPRPMGRSHIYVPRRLNLEERFRERSEFEEVTTLMIRNVPNRYDRVMLMQELDMLGFQSKYDFLYLPIDNATHWNVGYAFVNFDEPKDAENCMRALEGHQFFKFRQGKKRVAQVSVAHIQGLEQNLAHCSGTSVFSVPSPWLRPWVRRRPARTGQGSELDLLSNEEGEKSKIGNLLCAEDDLDEPPNSTPQCPAPMPVLEPRLDNSTVELRISSGTNEAVWDTVMRHVISSGARRLKLLPSSPMTRLIGGGGALLSPRIKSTLQAIVDLPELANVEVEVATAENEAPIVLTRSQMKEQLGLRNRSWKDQSCADNSTNSVDAVLRALGADVIGESMPASHNGGMLRGMSLPPESMRSGSYSSGTSKLRSGSLTNWRRAPRGNGSRPPRRRGAADGSVGASKRHGSGAGAWGPNHGVQAAPGQGGDAAAQEMHVAQQAHDQGADTGMQADSWPALGKAAPAATDVVWPQQPPQQQPESAQDVAQPYVATAGAWQQPMPNGSEAWPAGMAAAFSENDIRLWYLCPSAWMQGPWDGSMGQEVDGCCGQEAWNDPQNCVNTDGSTTGTDGADGVASPVEGSDTAAQVDSAGSSDTGGETEAKACGEPITTLMIRNIPANYGQDMVFRELEALGLHLACNFIYLPYLPVDTVMPWNIGCAFVNFWTPEDAERARSVLAGHVWTDYVTGHRKVADISNALIQGYEANVRHYNLTAVKDAGWSSSLQEVDWTWAGSAPPAACTPNFASMPSSPAPDHLPEPCAEEMPQEQPPPALPPCLEERGRSGSWEVEVPERILSRTPSPELRQHPCAPHLQYAAYSPNLGPSKPPLRVRSRSPLRGHECQVDEEAEVPALGSWPDLPDGGQRQTRAMSSPEPAPEPAPGAAEQTSGEGDLIPPPPPPRRKEPVAEPRATGALGGNVPGVVKVAGAGLPEALEAPHKRPTWTVDRKKEEKADGKDGKGADEDEKPLGIEEWPSLGGGHARRRKPSRCARPRLPRSEIVNGTVR